MRRRIFLSLLLGGMPVLSKTRRAKGRRPSWFMAWATAHSQEGITADGSVSRKGLIAADPRVLPLGSRVRISGAGRYSGVYMVRDTGPAIKGREVDIYMPSNTEARKFGRKRVKVNVLEWGEEKK